MYFYKAQKEILYMLYAYAKSDSSSLSDCERKVLWNLAKELNDDRF